MRLHVSPTSPYVRKARVAVIETGQGEAVEMVPAGGTPLDAANMPLAANPLGKIPVLERAEGPALYDSRVICRYLDDRAGAGLYPGPPRLWETLTLEATADGIMDAAAGMVYEVRLRPGDHVNAALLDGLWAKIARAVAALEGRWLAQLAGPPEMGHFAVAIALDYLDLRHPERPWRDAAPGLAAWHAGFVDRPSMRETAPPVA